MPRLPLLVLLAAAILSSCVSKDVRALRETAAALPVPITREQLEETFQIIAIESPQILVSSRSGTRGDESALLKSGHQLEYSVHYWVVHKRNLLEMLHGEPPPSPHSKDSIYDIKVDASGDWTLDGYNHAQQNRRQLRIVTAAVLIHLNLEELSKRHEIWLQEKPRKLAIQPLDPEDIPADLLKRGIRQGSAETGLILLFEETSPGQPTKGAAIFTDGKDHTNSLERQGYEVIDLELGNALGNAFSSDANTVIKAVILPPRSTN